MPAKHLNTITCTTTTNSKNIPKCNKQNQIGNLSEGVSRNHGSPPAYAPATIHLHPFLLHKNLLTTSHSLKKFFTFWYYVGQTSVQGYVQQHIRWMQHTYMYMCVQWSANSDIVLQHQYLSLSLVFMFNGPNTLCGLLSKTLQWMPAFTPEMT